MLFRCFKVSLGFTLPKRADTKLRFRKNTNIDRPTPFSLADRFRKLLNKLRIHA